MKIAAAVCLLLAISAKADVVLNKKMMKLALQAAELSALAYEEAPPGGEYDDFGYFDDEPDQALTAKLTGDGFGTTCFGAFRGTTLTWTDWQQNFNPGKMETCVDTEEGETDCCTTRTGFYEGYWTNYKEEFEESIRNCSKSCASPDECVVLTGHSQGGAIAAVAALQLADLNPYVITFGQPNTIDAPCELVTSSRWYRFVNTKVNSHVGLTYDPVPFVPGLGTDAYGNMILLSNDYSGVAFIGLDAQEFFSPLNIPGFEAHSMISTTKYPGYLDRLKAIMANATYPIRTTGYKAGSICTEDKECETEKCQAETHISFKRCVGVECSKDNDCNETGRCDNGICLPKLGSCAGCDENSDCAGGKCLLFRCSGSNGLMDNNCICKWDSDCDSGRCEGYLPPQCEAKLGLGAHCNENSDCRSDYCSWHYRCADKSRAVDLSNATVPKPEVPAKKSKKGLLISLCVVGGLILAGLGYVFGKKLLNWSQGYEEIASDAVDV